MLTLTATGTCRPRAHQSATWASAALSTYRVIRCIEPGALGERDELLRRDQPALGVAPAHQRLGPQHGSVRQADLGLVVQLEVAVVECLPQRGDGTEPLRRVRVTCDVVDLDPGLLALGDVHRDVGATQQRVDGVAVDRRERDADRHVHVHEHALEPERLGERGPDPAGDLDRVGRRPDVGQQHAELVAAEASDHVVRAHRAQHAAGDDLAGAGHRRGGPSVSLTSLKRSRSSRNTATAGAVALGLGERVLEPLREQRPVGQVGQRVVHRLALLLARQRRGLVHPEQRQQQQRHQLPRHRRPSRRRTAPIASTANMENV